MLFFFRTYSSEENILALSILYTASLLFLRALIGLYYLKKITDEVPDLAGEIAREKELLSRESAGA